MTKTISIVGCGWLGLPLAEHLVKIGYFVNGSTTDASKFAEIEAVGATPFLVLLSSECNNDYDEAFLDCDTLIVNFPPHRRDDIIEFHQQQYKAICDKIKQSKVKNIVMVSSTSVYPDIPKILTEADAINPDKASGKALLTAESIVQNSTNKEVTIVRFGGLIGYDRNPARFLSGKKDLKDGNAAVNLIHRDDCISIITKIIQQEKWGRVYNACCDEHPTRKEFYCAAARFSGFPEPVFSENEPTNGYKIIDSTKLKTELNYSFTYKSPLDCLK